MPLSSTLWMAAGLLWILDASINISMEPFRAFVADMLPDEQRARGFTMQSFFIGVGSVAASSLPLLLYRWFGFSTAAGAKAIPEIVRAAYWVGALAFLGAVLFTILTTKEYPPASHELERLKTAEKFDFAEILHSLANMPKTMRQLALVQLLTWLGLFCMFLYFSVAVAHNVFGATSTQEAAYTEGVIWAGYCSGVYNAVCFTASPLLPLLVNSERRAITEIEQDQASFTDPACRQEVEKLLEMKQQHLKTLESLTIAHPEMVAR